MIRQLKEMFEIRSIKERKVPMIRRTRVSNYEGSIRIYVEGTQDYVQTIDVFDKDELLIVRDKINEYLNENKKEESK